MIKLRRPVRAILFDLDGTLYYQYLLRALIALELAALPISLGSLKAAARTWRALHAFRRVREELRAFETSVGSIADVQYSQTADRLGVDPAFVKAQVEEWMLRRPLKYLAPCRNRGCREFFSWWLGLNHHIGIFSDYPACEKLQALGLSDRIWPILCATDPEINAFKPHPKGFLYACRIWGLDPDEVIYVGDRAEVDAVGAAAAGMPCAIFSNRRPKGFPLQSAAYFTISSFSELQHVLDNSLKN